MATIFTLPPGAKRTPAETNIEVQMLEQDLLRYAFGEIAEYSHLSGLIGRDVRGDAKGSMRRALRKAIRDHGRNFIAVPNRGYERIDAVGTITKSDGRRLRARTQSRLAIEELNSCVDRQELTAQDRLRYDMQVTVHAMLLDQIRPKNMKRLEAQVANAQAVIPPAKALEAFLVEDKKKKTEQREKTASEPNGSNLGPDAP